MDDTRYEALTRCRYCHWSALMRGGAPDDRETVIFLLAQLRDHVLIHHPERLHELADPAALVEAVQTNR